MRGFLASVPYSEKAVKTWQRVYRDDSKEFVKSGEDS